MNEAIETSIAEEGKDGAENLSAEAYLRRLSEGSAEESQTEEEEVTEEEIEDTEEEADVATEDEIEDAEEESDDEDEESDEIDLLDLDPEQFQALVEKHKSRLLKRVGELTAQKKALAEQLEQVSAKEPAPSVPHDTNPFKELASMEEIQAKHADFQKTLEQTDAILEEYADYGPDDIIEVAGQEYTKKDIRKAHLNARDAITKFLPAQRDHLQKLESYKVTGEQWQEQAKEEVPEILDEESNIGKAYKALVADPLVQKLKTELPELGVQIEFLLAHAARSKFGMSKPKIAKGAGKNLKVRPPDSPVGAGGGKGRRGHKDKLKEAWARYERTGRAEDRIAFSLLKSQQ